MSDMRFRAPELADIRMPEEDTALDRVESELHGLLREVMSQPEKRSATLTLKITVSGNDDGAGFAASITKSLPTAKSKGVVVFNASGNPVVQESEQMTMFNAAQTVMAEARRVDDGNSE